jgi:folate-binding protein YgfZ
MNSARPGLSEGKELAMIIQAMTDMSPTPPLPPANFHGACELPHLGVIEVSGSDAVSFLQNQLTHDLALIPADGVRFSSFCNAKGRMQATFVLCVSAPDTVLMVCRRDLLAAVCKRLSMFVLRAKARLRDATDDFALWGLVGGPLPPTWKKQSHVGGNAMGLYPAGGQARALWLAPAGHSPVSPSHSAALDLDAWMWGEVMAGVADVQAATVEAFVPQMLNHESIDGVSFKKGCYPGQEVVARSQFRGAIKRRAFILSGPPMPVGEAVFSDHDPNQDCGTIAQAALDGVGGGVAIACLQTAAVDGAALHLGAADGPLLQLLPLPYPLRDDI